jgi:hypothetical protein
MGKPSDAAQKASLIDAIITSIGRVIRNMEEQGKSIELYLIRKDDVSDFTLWADGSLIDKFRYPYANRRQVRAAIASRISNYTKHEYTVLTDSNTPPNLSSYIIRPVTFDYRNMP